MEIRKEMPIQYRWFFEPLTKISEVQQNAMEFQKHQENGAVRKLNSNISRLMRESEKIAEKLQRSERKYDEMLRRYRVWKFLDERLTEFRYFLMLFMQLWKEIWFFDILGNNTYGIHSIEINDKEHNAIDGQTEDQTEM